MRLREAIESIGADEFAHIQKEVCDRLDAEALQSTLKAALEEHFPLDGNGKRPYGQTKEVAEFFDCSEAEASQLVERAPSFKTPKRNDYLRRLGLTPEEACPNPETVRFEVMAATLVRLNAFRENGGEERIESLSKTTLRLIDYLVEHVEFGDAETFLQADNENRVHNNIIENTANFFRDHPHASASSDTPEALAGMVGDWMAVRDLLPYQLAIIIWITLRDSPAIAAESVDNVQDRPLAQRFANVAVSQIEFPTAYADPTSHPRDTGLKRAVICGNRACLHWSSRQFDACLLEVDAMLDILGRPRSTYQRETSEMKADALFGKGLVMLSLGNIEQATYTLENASEWAERSNDHRDGRMDVPYQHKTNLDHIKEVAQMLSCGHYTPPRP